MAIIDTNENAQLSVKQQIDEQKYKLKALECGRQITN